MAKLKLRTRQERPSAERSVVRPSQCVRPGSHKERRGGQPCPASEGAAVRPLGAFLADGAQQVQAVLRGAREAARHDNWSLQLEALTKAGVDDRDIFREKASGAKRDRTELRRMLDQLRPGDQATVYRLDRLARSQLHLLQIIEEIEGKGAKIVSLMDNIDTGTATGTMVVGVLAVLAEFERNLLIERCAAGVKIARQRNVRFGRPPKLTPSLIRQVLYHLRLISSGWLAWATNGSLSRG